MIDVYGGIFIDICVNGVKPHEKKVDISFGGSGFNFATGFSILNNKVRFIGNIGKDFFYSKIKFEFDKYGINYDYLKINEIKPDVFISENEKPFAIERKNNDLDIKIPKKKSEYAYVNSEINQKSLKKVLDLNYKIIFIDTGPRHFLFNNYIKKSNHFLITNIENEFVKKNYNLLKMDVKGFKIGNIHYLTNGKHLKNKFGTGDLLDVLFIDSLIKNDLKEEKIKSFIKIIEKTSEINCAYNKILSLKNREEF